MSDGTVQRYIIKKAMIAVAPIEEKVEVVLASDYDALRAKVEALEQENSGLKGGMAQWCRDERGAGNGPCGACSICCKELNTQLAAVTTERDRLRLALLYLAKLGGGRSEGNYYAQAALHGEPGGG